MTELPEEFLILESMPHLWLGWYPLSVETRPVVDMQVR